jgi:hypothetical protein
MWLPTPSTKSAEYAPRFGSGATGGLRHHQHGVWPDAARHSGLAILSDPNGCILDRKRRIDESLTQTRLRCALGDGTNSLRDKHCRLLAITSCAPNSPT